MVEYPINREPTNYVAILEASQEILGITQPDKLIDKLFQIIMQIIMQNSGCDDLPSVFAHRCVFMLTNINGDLQIKAIATSETTELYPEFLEDNPNLPIKLINYLKKNQEIIVINELETDLPIIDQYLQQHKPSCLLGLPILKQGHLIGILYVENFSTTGIFTEDVITILNFLCTQVAIYLNNIQDKTQDKTQEIAPFCRGHKLVVNINGESEIVCLDSDLRNGHKKAEDALRESQQFLQTVLYTFPLSIFWKDRNSVYLGCNGNFLQDAGLKSVEDIIGKNDYDMPWAKTEAEDYRIDDQYVMESDIAKLGIIETQIQADGKQIWLETNKIPLHNLMGEVIGVLGTYQDITNRVKAEQTIRQKVEREKLLREIAQRIRQSLDLQTIFDTACQEIRQVIQADRVGIFKFYSDSNFDDGEFVAESVLEGFSSVVAVRVHDQCFGENFSSLYAKGKFYAVDDIYCNGGDKLKNCHSEVLSKFQVRANLVMPLLCGEKLWGLLCIHQCAAPRKWQQSEIDLTQQLSNQLAIGIQQASFYDQIQSELRVREQTEARIALQLRRQQALGTIIQKIRESLDIGEILSTVTQQVKDIMHSDRVIIFRLLTNGKSRIVEEAVSDDFPTLKGIDREDEVWSQDILDSYSQGKPHIVPDNTNYTWEDCLMEYSMTGKIQSKIVAPILQEMRISENHRWVAPGENNKLWGILVVHACGKQRV